MTREQMWAAIETKRHGELKRHGIALSTNMIAMARCPRCTLQPPCKHYQSTDEIIADVYNVFNGNEEMK